MARPSKPHHQSWDNKAVPGLYRCPDGRWRVRHNGRDIKFTEKDEKRAIARARKIMGTDEDARLRIKPKPTETNKRGTIIFTSSYVTVSDFWARVAEELTVRPEHAAQMTGIPQLAHLRNMDLPKPALRLEKLRKLYMDRSDAKADSKAEACRTFDHFIKITGAQTLADLTTDRLRLYRQTIQQQVSSPGTIAAYYGRCKWIIGFAKTEGEDAAQIDAALSRMAILKVPKDKRVHQPTPVSPGDFHILLLTAQEQYPAWHPRLLLMLNLCLHFDECLDLEWGDFNLEAGTFCTKRNKRGRVIRAATLWPQTLDALRQINRTGSPYLFVSAHGTRYNAKGQWKTWHKLRKAAGCPKVQMDDIRDGAYTAACQAPGVEEKLARLLAGHRSHGLQDNYVQRNPLVVASACQAVYDHYFISAASPLRDRAGTAHRSATDGGLAA